MWSHHRPHGNNCSSSIYCQIQNEKISLHEFCAKFKYLYNHSVYTYLNIVHISVSETIIYEVNTWAILLETFLFNLISWRLITLQYCSGFCHTLTCISLGYTCIPHPNPLSHLPLHPNPLGLPSAPGPGTCLMHPAWAGDLFHPR